MTEPGPTTRKPILVPLLVAGSNLLPIVWVYEYDRIGIAIVGLLFGVFCFLISRAKGSIAFRIVACACLTAFTWTIAMGMNSIPRPRDYKTFILPPIDKQK